MFTVWLEYRRESNEGALSLFLSPPLATSKLTITRPPLCHIRTACTRPSSPTQDLSSAVNCKRAMHNLELYGRKVRVTFAKTKSHAAMIEDGTFGKPSRASKAPGGGSSGKPKSTVSSTIPATAAAAAADGPAAMEEDEDEEGEANNILFIQGLPLETTMKEREEMLEVLFSQQEGFKEVRLVENRPEVGFVEYETDVQATEGKSMLQGFAITPTDKMRISFAKK